MEITRCSFYILEINSIFKSIAILCIIFFLSFFSPGRYDFNLSNSNYIQCAKLPTHAVAYEAYNDSYIHTYVLGEGLD